MRPKAGTGESQPAKMTLAFGATLGAVWGAILGARLTSNMADVRGGGEGKRAFPTTSNASAISNLGRPFSRELHFPSKPAADWQDPQPSRLPKPTYAPAAMAFGLALSAAGVVTRFWVSLAGFICFLLGIASWIGDLLHEHK